MEAASLPRHGAIEPVRALRSHLGVPATAAPAFGYRFDTSRYEFIIRLSLSILPAICSPCTVAVMAWLLVKMTVPSSPPTTYFGTNQLQFGVKTTAVRRGTPDVLPYPDPKLRGPLEHAQGLKTGQDCANHDFEPQEERT